MDNLALCYGFSFWFLSTSFQLDLRTYDSLYVQALVTISSVPLPNSFHGDLRDLWACTVLFTDYGPLFFNVTYRTYGYVLFQIMLHPFLM